MTTRFQLHKAEWDDCTKCRLSERRKRVVHYRGQIPCDILFVGEAPGRGENTIGKPFVGPAGHLLDEIVEKSVEGKYSCGFANLVGCIPLEEDQNRKTIEPSVEEIKACKPRLEELIELAQPRVLVAVGKLSELWMGFGKKPNKKYVKIPEDVIQVHIVHPAAILKADSTQKWMLVQNNVLTLWNIVQGLDDEQ